MELKSNKSTRFSTARRVLGVTTGIGHLYSRVAPLAAKCFEHHTGISTVVLGDKHLASSRVLHPAALRLQLFEYFDAQVIVYFDADWFCLRDWSPLELSSNRAIIACRDFVLTDEWPRQHYDFSSAAFLDAPAPYTPAEPSEETLRKDYIEEVRSFAGISAPWANWVNSGLIIFNRDHHRPLLDLALDLYLGAVGHHPEYYEQPALNKAIEMLGIPPMLIARKYNVLAAYESKWPSSVVGLHVKLKRHFAFVAAINAGSLNTPDEVHRFFSEK